MYLVLFVPLFLSTCRIIETLGGKQLVMALLQHDDPNVRYNALVSLQKIMVHNW